MSDLNLKEKSNVPEGEVAASSSKPKKRPGKASARRRADNFRERVGKPKLEKYHADIRRRLLGDESGILEQSLTAMNLTCQSRAIPLTVSLRGPGFIASMEYDRIVSTWSMREISAICTIYQFYRVTLYLFYYKLYLAQQIQTEPKSYHVGVMITIREEWRQELATILQIPAATSAGLSCIGRVESEGQVYHSVLPNPPERAPDAENAQYFTQCITPNNIRQLLDALSNVEVAVEFRTWFEEHNSLPGALFQDHLLANPNDIWPAVYNLDDFAHDVLCYNNLLTRVGPRLPNHFLTTTEWGGAGTEASLVCTDLHPIRIRSRFAQIPDRAIRRIRDAQGALIRIALPQDGLHLQVESVEGRQSTLHWTINNAWNEIDAAIGALSFVGEQYSLPTRLQIVGRKFNDLSAVTILTSLINAPRPAKST